MVINLGNSDALDLSKMYNVVTILKSAPRKKLPKNCDEDHAEPKEEIRTHSGHTNNFEKPHRNTSFVL